jgi:ribosomal protein L11 methylase PrmA
VDLDAVAVEATRRNAVLNGATEVCTSLECGPSAADPDPLEACKTPVPLVFDVCFANILKPTLMDLHARLSGYVRPGGTLVLSGIFDNQVRRSLVLCCFFRRLRLPSI